MYHKRTIDYIKNALVKHQTFGVSFAIKTSSFLPSYGCSRILPILFPDSK